MTPFLGQGACLAIEDACGVTVPERASAICVIRIQVWASSDVFRLMGSGDSRATSFTMSTFTRPRSDAGLPDPATLEIEAAIFYRYLDHLAEAQA